MRGSGQGAIRVSAISSSSETSCDSLATSCTGFFPRGWRSMKRQSRRSLCTFTRLGPQQPNYQVQSLHLVPCALEVELRPRPVALQAAMVFGVEHAEVQIIGRHRRDRQLSAFSIQRAAY